MRSVAELCAEVQKGTKPKYVFFWGHKARADGQLSKTCFSQWWPASFEVEGVTYPSAEHYMMAGKARLFGDEVALAGVLASPSPAAAKRWGRKVRGFVEAEWQAARFGIVVDASVAKFGQNPDLGAFLKGTGKRVLVEASPVDRIWGIGMAADHEHAMQPRKWRGLNLLGFALMEARSRLG